MSNYAVMPKEDYVAICDVIRDKKETSETFKSGNIPQEVGKVYDKGYDEGHREGHDHGEVAGVYTGFHIGVGFGEDVQNIAIYQEYYGNEFIDTYAIRIDNPKRLVISVQEYCNFNAIRIVDAAGITHDVKTECGISELGGPQTYSFDLPEGIVCNAEDGYASLYLEGNFDTYVGVSLTSTESGGGYEEGYAEGVEQGKEDRDLEWWRTYQGVNVENGGWSHYMFAGAAWNKETFKPKFDIQNYSPFGAGNANSIFQNHNNDDEPYDLAEHLESLGVKLDFSTFNAAVNAFNAARISRLPSIDITVMAGSYNTSSIFASKYIETIDKLICCERTFDYYNNEFSGATALKNITIEGVIANNKLNFSACTKLSKASHVSIVEHILVTKTMSITFSKAAVNTAFETSAGTADGSTSAEWLALVASKPNCTISLA